VPLPRLPDPALDAELEHREDSGFLSIERLRMRISGGERFSYDVVTLRALDAVIIAAHFERDGRRHVLLCGSIRPPVYWRDRDPGRARLWEVPAGLVEPGETFRVAAARELFEETGARVSPDALFELGPPLLPAPAMIAEVHVFFHAAIDPAALVEPPGDASPLERAAVLTTLPLDEALALCASGEIRDSKTELALRRLRDVP